MLFLPPNQQRQITEGKSVNIIANNIHFNSDKQNALSVTDLNVKY